MRGVVWTAAIWGAFLLGAAWWQRKRGDRGWFRRENIALILALLGTHAVAARTSAEEVLQDPVVLERAVRGALAGLALAIAVPILISRLRIPHSPGNRALTALGIYAIVGAASVMYSVAPVVSAAKIVELVAGLVAVAAIALGPRPHQSLLSTVGLVIGLEASLIAVSVVGYVAGLGTFAQIQERPGFISALTMISPYAHSNTLSSIGATVAAFGLAKFFELESDRRWWLALFGLGTIGTILASGRQGVAIWVVSVLVLLVINRRQVFVMVLAPAALLAVFFAWDDIADALQRGRPQQVSTLTGRLYWWEAAVKAWSQHPWTGYGFGAGGRFVALQSLGAGRRSNVHSGYFEALVGVGILGLAPLIYAMFKVVFWSAKNLLRRTDTAVAVLIIPLILHTAIDQGFGAWLHEDFVLLACLAGLADRAFIVARERHAPVVTLREPVRA